ncbi:MAG: sialate O-acetylesterase [Planctomycetota bacterium]
MHIFPSLFAARSAPGPGRAIVGLGWLVGSFAALLATASARTAAPAPAVQALGTTQVVTPPPAGAPGSVRVNGYQQIVRDLVLWCRSDQSVETTYAGSVGAWLDRSKRQAHLGQENLTLAPRLEALGAAGYPELVFDGYDRLETGAALPTGSYTMGVVFRLLPSSVGGSVLAGASYELSLNAGGITIEQGGGVLALPSALATGKPYVLLSTYDAGTGTVQVELDGVPIGGGNLAANADPGCVLGGLDGSFQGAVSEVLVFQRALDAAGRATINNYLVGRYLTGPQLPLVAFDELPDNGELLPRALPASTAALHIGGTVREPGFTTVVGVVHRDGQLFAIDTQPLTYAGNQAAFDLDFVLDALLAEYELTVSLVAPGSVVTPVARREHLVAGDVFVIGGQSNALAPDFEAEGLGNSNQVPWIRSFGTASESPAESTGDRTWDLAGALDFDGHAFVGQWGLRMGKELVTATGVPVAIINTSMGATTIAQHLRWPMQPEDPNSIYGRGLGRLRAAGLDDDVRAVFWYQGESDTGHASSWRLDFDQLRVDWMLDYPLIEKLFVFQIREGCGSLNGGVREVQRNLQSWYGNVELMSTSALPGHNGCHFGFAGYDQLGLDISRQVLRDLYGVGGNSNVDPPQLLSAQWQGAGRQMVRLIFENANDTLVWQAGTEQFVFFDDLAVRATGIVVSGNTVDLTLNQPAPFATQIFYVGHAYDGPALVNANGVGALTFFGVPIL